MPPLHDDPDLGGDAYVLRALHPRWITSKGGRPRPTSDAFQDSNFENSCFAEGEIEIDEIRALVGFERLAKIPVRVLREAGFWLERRPHEAPEGCTHPNSHIVCGPPKRLDRKPYEKAARAIATAPDVELL